MEAGKVALLTKSKVMSWRQCPKRLWQEANGGEEPAAARQGLDAGQDVGELARRVLGPVDAVLIDARALGSAAALARTTELMERKQALFEAAFADDDAIAYADAIRPSGAGWHMVEVKASGSVKPHHIDDLAVQLHLARGSVDAGWTAAVAHLDTSWTYPGEGDYRGLFKEADVTAQVDARTAQVPGWIEAAAATLRSPEPPTVPTGKHCEDPYPCPFHEACSAAEPKLERPISWLPGQLRKPAKALRDAGALQMDEIPDEFLSEAQLRVKTQTLAGEAYFDQAGAASALSDCEYPLYFLDFETVNPAIPRWAGTRPYAQVPFQFSVHIVRQDGSMAHQDFLSADGEDPSPAFAEALVDAVGPSGAVVVYNAAFEGGRLKELAGRFPQLADRLLAIAGRLFDLQPVAKAHYYHPMQQGSWSIKKVLPCLIPELQYDALDGVQDGGMAIDACMELLSPGCTFERRADLEGQLRRYCRLDTLAMVGIWGRFVGADRLLEAVLAAGRPGADAEV